MLAMIPASMFLQADLQSDLTAILQNPALERAAVGVFVQELGGDVPFSVGADKRLMPASALKLVTATYALDSLGAKYSFVTSAWKSEKGVFLKGGADPMLSISELQDLGDRLGLQRGQTVQFDDSFLGADRVNGAWEYGDMMRSDAPPVSGLTVNGGYADLAVSAGVPRLTPRNFGMVIKRGRTEGEPRVRREHASWTVSVTGKLPDNDPSFATVSLPDPALCAAMILTGKAQRAEVGAPPADAVRIQKRTLADVLPDLLKRSDNHAAETVFRLAGKANGASGSWDDAIDNQRAFLKRIGILPEAFRVVDGSGLSRFNEITPRALVQCLRWTLQRETSAVYGSAMCAPGEGTLRSRLAGVDVRAKTGTLTGVCSLVGYVDAASGKRLLFAIVFNHYDGLASGVRPIQDAIVRRLATETRPELGDPIGSLYSRTR
jgi:D-alanyl-D-alanine carboxypeptidase/D-alanyl-D-alanine-endopeptidase (penicillin-binding protein 4)